MSLYLIVYFIFGLIVGSFLNVVIYRLNTGLSLVSGRSVCMKCGKCLKWYELVPVLSYVFLRGKCATCGDKISPQYVFVELASGAMFAIVGVSHGLVPTGALGLASIVGDLVLASLLIVIFVYDIRHKIIPNQIVIALFGAGILHVIGGAGAISLKSVLAGALIPSVAFFALWLISDGRLMGLGDVKLMAVLGMFLTWEKSVIYVMLAFMAGGFYAVLLYVMKRLRGEKIKNFMKLELPFAPFLVGAFALVYFGGWALLSFLSGLMGI